MGNYIATTDMVTAGLENEAKARTDLDRSGEIDETRVAEFIRQAESEMDKSFSKAGESVPLDAPLDAMILPIAIDIVRYRWWVGASPPAQVTERYKLAQAMLRRIADGVVLLDVAGREETGDQCPVEVRARAAVFTDAALEGF